VTWRRIAGAAAVLLLAAMVAALSYHHGLRTAVQRSEVDPVDVGFAQAMRAHHDQAVVMTQIVLGSADTQLRSLAQAMQSAQLIEIGQIKGWLQLWDAPMLPARPGMDWMLLGREPLDDEQQRYLVACRDAAGGMPGLATQDELAQLRSLGGLERDRLFLTLMIRHHEGALPMARFAARNASSAAVRTLAAEIAMTQAQETVTMARLLQRLAS